MRRSLLSTDPTYYRLEYWRLTTLLLGDGDAEAPGGEEADLPRELELVVDAVIAELTLDEFGTHLKPRSLSAETMGLLVTTLCELRELRWHWVGRPPPWFLRWARLRRPQYRREYKLLAEFLDSLLEPATVVLYCTCLVNEGLLGHRIAPWPREGGPVLKRPKPDGEKQLDWTWIYSYLDYLRAAPSPPPNVVERVGGFLGYVPWRRRRDPSPRVRYSLACLFSRLAAATGGDDDPPKLRDAYLDEAARQLEWCIEPLRGAERKALGELARRDPGLVELRKDWRGSALFAMVMPGEES